MASWVGTCAASSSVVRWGRVCEALPPRTPSLEAPQAAGSLAGERLPPAPRVVLNYSSEEALWLYCFHLLQKEQCLFSEAAIWSNRG